MDDIVWWKIISRKDSCYLLKVVTWGFQLARQTPPVQNKIHRASQSRVLEALWFLWNYFRARDFGPV